MDDLGVHLFLETSIFRVSNMLASRGFVCAFFLETSETGVGRLRQPFGDGKGAIC